MMIRSTLIHAAAILALVTTAAPAAAETGSRRVSYDDLDLSRSAGIATLRQRLAGAVEQVCGRVEVRSLSSGKAVQACRRQAERELQPKFAAAIGQIRLAEAR